MPHTTEPAKEQHTARQGQSRRIGTKVYTGIRPTLAKAQTVGHGGSLNPLDANEIVSIDQTVMTFLS